jgi:hypothetical protein
MGKKIFVHIPKNGGMTIRRNPELRPKVLLATPENHINRQYTEDLFRVMQENREHHGFEHARWRDWNQQVRENHRAFAIVRNPWSRVVSRFEFAKKVIYKEDGSDHFGRTDYIDCSSFEAFLETRHEWGGRKFFWHRAIRGWYPALDYVTDEKGKLRCDILRFEHYDDDVKSYLGVLFNPEPRNVTGYKQSTYTDYYNDKTIQIVADWYKKDIDYWGFDFDSAAQRNYWR